MLRGSLQICPLPSSPFSPTASLDGSLNLPDTSVPSEHAAPSACNALSQLPKFLLIFQDARSPGVTSSGKVSLAPSSQVGLESSPLWSHRILHYVATVCVLMCLPHKPGWPFGGRDAIYLWIRSIGPWACHSVFPDTVPNSTRGPDAF